MEKEKLSNLSRDSMFLPIYFKVVLNQIRKVKGIQINLGLDQTELKYFSFSL